ncbi:MAG: integrin alpha [Pseudomonadota bacterium]
MGGSVKLSWAAGWVALASTLAQAAVFPPEIEVSSFLSQNGGDGSVGLAILGAVDEDAVGEAVTSGGDINGDGVADIALGAPGFDFDGNNRSGGVFVLYGDDALGADIDLTQLTPAANPDGSAGFLITTFFGSVRLGETAADIGDLSGDGTDDLLFAAPSLGAGVAYLLEGRLGAAPFPAIFDVDELTFNGVGANFVGSVEPESPPGLPDEEAGRALAAAGDVNGDGISDLIIGGPAASLPDLARPKGVGRSYVVYGPTDRLRNNNDLLDWTAGGGNDGTLGFVLDGFEQDSRVGTAVSTAGDLNGDGLDDVAIVALGLGQVVVIYGRTELFPVEYDMRAFAPQVADGALGFVIETGRDVSLVGSKLLGGVDWNGDGRDDLVVTDFGTPPQVFIIYGRGDNFEPQFDLNQLRDGDGSAGVQIIPARDERNSLTALTSGDLNHDGLTDLVIGAASNERAYLLFGRQGGFPAQVDLENLFAANGGDGSRGVVLTLDDGGNNTFGLTMSAGGDVNGDGTDDLTIGAPNAFTAGAAFVLYGRADSDADGIADRLDNCIDVPNGDQRDTNGDGYGNACDADLDDDCIVLAQDWFIMRDVLGTDDGDADLDGNGVVDIGDALTLFQRRLQPPGPSGVSDTCP